MASSHGVPLEESITTVLRASPLVLVCLVGEECVVLTAHVGELAQHVGLDVPILHHVFKDCTGNGFLFLIVELLLDKSFKPWTHRSIIRFS